MAWVFDVTCSSCTFTPREIVLGAADINYICPVCSDIVQFRPTPLRVTAFECPHCHGSLIGATVVGRDKPITCPGCYTGILMVREKMHALVNHELPDIHDGDVVHGRVIKRGRFFQLELHMEPNLRGRFSSQPSDEMVGVYVESTVVEVGRKTLVVDHLRPLDSALVAAAGLSHY